VKELLKSSSHPFSQKASSYASRSTVSYTPIELIAIVQGGLIGDDPINNTITPEKGGDVLCWDVFQKGRSARYRS